ncbi:hypothetical protein [Paludisphaera sp.]|uniref:hypothetical protein n=1 Tax=Paludisphaera sp. TaxID=2017432 RepID=UPI00301E565A
MPFTYDGPEGESVFRTFLHGLVAAPGVPVEEAVATLLSPIREKLDELESLHDFQQGILFGALLVEYTLDQMLKGLMPGFDQVKHLSFSVKIKIARALSICPRRILEAADSIGIARNKIAHNLGYRSYTDLPTEIRNKVEHGRRGFYDPPTSAPVEEGLNQFIFLAMFTASALLVYANHSRHLRDAIEEHGFIPALLAKAHPQGDCATMGDLRSS